LSITFKNKQQNAYKNESSFFKQSKIHPTKLFESDTI